MDHLYLCKCPLTIDNENTFLFNDTTAQFNYFSSLEKIELQNFTYQRKDNVIRYPALIDNIINYNYCFYLNENTNVWYYCFITDIRYVNDNMTEISIKTDVFQTWFSQLTYKQSFIERCHVIDDTIGANTTPEGLETGEYICKNITKYNALTEIAYVLLATEPFEGDADYATPLAGIWYTGTAYISKEFNDILQIILKYNSLSKADAMYGLYTVPAACFNNLDPVHFGGQEAPNILAYSLESEIVAPYDNFTPKNNKTLCYPYRYLTVSNNAGGADTLHFERFKDPSGDTQYNFKISCCGGIGGSIKISPINYDYVNSSNEIHNLVLGKFPTLNWFKDEFTNWLTQNAVNLAVGTAGDILSVASHISSGVNALNASYYAETSKEYNAATKDMASSASGLTNDLLSVGSTLGQIYAHSLQPNSAKGATNCGDINTADGSNTFYFYQMAIRKEIAMDIDEYFTMFGYKVTGTANLKTYLHTRKNFNYIKTVHANILGDIPQKDLDEIKARFDNGIRLWHNTANFLDFSVDNSII